MEEPDLGLLPCSGKVFDDEQNLLVNAKVHVHSLNLQVPFDETTSTNREGYYRFPRVPAGIQIAISVSYPGYTPRQRVEVLKRKYDFPDTNIYDFGVDPSGYGSGSINNALSDKPEVTKITPGRSASGLQAQTPFVLAFSEPVNTEQFEKAFAIRAFKPVRLAVDRQDPDQHTLTGPAGVDFTNPQLISGTPIWDSKAFDISWNDDKTEATFHFKPGFALPTNHDPQQLPQYQIALQSFDGNFKGFADSGGIPSASNPFKLTDGNFEAFSLFTVAADLQAPQLSDIKWLGSYTAPVFGLQFSEPMVLPTVGYLIAGGMNGKAAEAAVALPEYGVSSQQAAQNYLLTLKRNGVVLKDQIPWSEFRGHVERSADNREVVLNNEAKHHFLPELKPGDEITITVSATVRDPAGNFMSPSHSQQTLIIP